MLICQQGFFSPAQLIRARRVDASALQHGIVSTNRNQLFIGIAHLHVLSIGPLGFRHLTSLP
jgi:hypothetical protein